MLRLIRFLIFGDAHIHKWETLKEIDIIGEDSSIPIAKKYVCRCTICGKIKKFRV